MANGWWGNWRPSLPAHTGDLQPTDLIECTSMSGGVPTNTVITGQQIIDAAQGGGGGATWGGITGTLSSQSDLQTALNGKQDTLVSGTNIKTVNSTSLLGSGNVNIGPRLIGWSGILGTPTTGTAVGICHSILIPANTLGTNNILQLVFRMYRQSGNAGQLYGRIYSNTTNSISGATLIGGLFTINGGGVQFVAYCERNYSYDGTNLRTISATSFSEYAAGTIQSTALNRTVNQYILFTMQAQNLADTGNVDLVKVFAYV
jgi:hypothetical protein